MRVSNIQHTGQIAYLRGLNDVWLAAVFSSALALSSYLCNAEY